MNDDMPEEQTADLTTSLPLIGGVLLVLVSIVFLAYQYSKPRTGSVVLPGGITYLGPSPAAKSAEDRPRFTLGQSADWTTIQSTKYGYTFSVPKALTIEPFLTDEFDAYAITWNNAVKEANVLIGVEDLSHDDKRAPYVNKTKKEFIESFWSKQYNLTGVKSLTPFTNKKGLIGYKVKFQTTDGASPYDDVFFAVSGKPNLVIHLSNAIMVESVFEKIVESVEWNM